MRRRSCGVLPMSDHVCPFMRSLVLVRPDPFKRWAIFTEKCLSTAWCSRFAGRGYGQSGVHERTFEIPLLLKWDNAFFWQPHGDRSADAEPAL